MARGVGIGGHTRGPLTPGRVVAVHGRYYRVETADRILECVTRGKKGGVACNDQVEVRPAGAAGGVIERILPRRNLLWRSDGQRAKLLAANVDRVLVVTAAVPSPRMSLLDRCLVAAEAAGIEALIVVNKADLDETRAFLERLAPYGALGYPILSLSALRDVTALLPWLKGRTSVLVGASGVGKSTLTNALVPEAHAATGEVSRALDAGRHTTTHTRLHHLPQGGALIDSPGMQEFGLRHLTLKDIQAAFPEIRVRLGSCRFHNCRHLQEPGCAVLEAVRQGRILEDRWRVFRDLVLDNSQTPRH